MSGLFSSYVWNQLTVLSLTFGMVGLGAIEPVLAQEARTRTLTVNGQATVEVPTSLSQVSLGIEVQGRTAEEVQQEVARRSDALVTLLRSRNVEKLQTTGVNLYPLYNSDGNAPRITGYTASNIVSFRLATDQAGTLLDEAVAAGATRIDGISFIASDEAIETARQQALRNATQDAQSQADTVLAALNLTRREIVNIQVSVSTPAPQPIVRGALESRAATFDESTVLVGGDQQVYAYVTLVIGY
ncbi:MAG: SIMPL domain-containing protein [Geitlerinemataceae cyanobacterium]